jgi:hypothetical protein
MRSSYVTQLVAKITVRPFIYSLKIFYGEDVGTFVSCRGRPVNHLRMTEINGKESVAGFKVIG